MKSTKVQEFILELLDIQMEEVSFAVREKAEGYSLADVDKIVSARVFLLEQNQLDEISTLVCNAWLDRDVNGLHADEVEEATVSNKGFADLEIVGGVYMMVEYYRKQLKVLEEYFDRLADDLVEFGYSRGSKEVSFFCKTLVRRSMMRNRYQNIIRFKMIMADRLDGNVVPEERIQAIVQTVHEFEGVI